MNNRTVELVDETFVTVCVRATSIRAIIKNGETVLVALNDRDAAVVKNDYKTLRTQWENALSYDAVGIIV